PVNAVQIGNGDKGVDMLRFLEHAREQIGLAGIVRVPAHGWADVEDEALPLRQPVIFAKERERLLRAETAGIFGKRLRGDADGLDLVTCFDQRVLRGVQKFQGVGHLGLIACAVEADESCDGADFGLNRLSRARALGDAGCAREQSAKQGGGKSLKHARSLRNGLYTSSGRLLQQSGTAAVLYQHGLDV